MKRCAGLIIRNAQGEYLLQMRDDTPGIVAPLTWDFFGGGVEEGEELIVAAAREMEEELGLTVSDGELEMEWSGIINGAEEHLFRLMRPVEWGEFKVLEGAGAAFFTPQEAVQLTSVSPLIPVYFQELLSADTAY